MLQPKSSKTLMKPTAEKLGCDEQMVDDVVNFFYADLRKSLADLEYPIIQLNGIGSFRVKFIEVPKLIIKYEKHLSVLKPETFNQMATLKDVTQKLEKVRRLKKIIDDEAERRREFFKNKNGNV